MSLISRTLFDFPGFRRDLPQHPPASNNPHRSVYICSDWAPRLRCAARFCVSRKLLVVCLRTVAQGPETAGQLSAVRWCEAEVCYGGLHQFFTNATDVLAPEAARGFRAINLPAIAEIVEKAM